jgi:hypothetical protein
MDESHVPIQFSSYGYKMFISDTFFGMIRWHVQQEPHSHRISNADVLHIWLGLKNDKSRAKYI